MRLGCFAVSYVLFFIFAETCQSGLFNIVFVAAGFMALFVFTVVFLMGLGLKTDVIYHTGLVCVIV